MLAKVLTDRHYRNRAELCMAIARVLRRQLEFIRRRHRTDWMKPTSADIRKTANGRSRPSTMCSRASPGSGPCMSVSATTAGRAFKRDSGETCIPFFNGLKVNHLVLEFARRGYDELFAFGEMDRRIGVGMGVIDIKDNEIESADLIAKRLEHAAAILGPERVQYIHPDCGFWMLQRNVADGKMRALVAGRDLFEGRR